MPVVNGYTFKSAGLVNLAFGHVEEGGRTCTRRLTHSDEEQEGSALDRQHCAGSISAAPTARPTNWTTPAARQPPPSTSRWLSADPWVQREAEEQLEQVS